ncbi:MAG: hypothetical protein LBL56_00135 [Treponema sp.]|jgi:hypothetical protein|nr:hypothetical protein [Treponema sp.]
MANRKLIIALLMVPVFFACGRTVEAQARKDPIDVNVIIDGSRYTQDLGVEISDWLCGYVVDGILMEGDYLQICIAGEKAQTPYAGIFRTEDRESLKALLRRALPGSEAADFAGALGGLSPGKDRSPLMTYTLLISTPRGLSPVHIGTLSSYLRFSRVMDFPGWRALVLAPDIGPRVQEAAGAFLAGR